MSENIKQEDLIEKDTTSVSEEETKEEETTEQDPVAVELERVQKSGGRTELEKAEFSLKKNAERLKELGGDPNATLGVTTAEPDPDDEDEKPLTVGQYRKLEQEKAAQTATKTALQLADEIENESQRELAKYHLENTIKSTGNPKEDLNLALNLVNAVKNQRILEEQARKTPPKTHSNASGVDAINTEVQGELTLAEKVFMGKPFNMTKEQIIKARTPAK